MKNQLGDNTLVNKRAVTSNACLTKLYVMAFTSIQAHASTSDYHNIELQYNESVQTMTLYDQRGVEFQLNKGDLWEFSLPSCLTLHTITRVSVTANGGDGWNIGSIVTLVRDTDDKIQLLSQDFSVNRWIDGNNELGHRNFTLMLSRSSASSDCLSRLYIMAFTSGLSDAGSDTDFSVQIQLNGQVQTSLLYDRLGNDFQYNKGDLWELLFSGFGFSENCIKISEIERISIVDSGIESDDWNIETIVTLVDDSSNNYQVLTHDFDVNHWINGHSTDSEHRRFDLNLADTGECSLETHNCQQGCVNSIGGFTCTCKPGYQLNSDQRTCIDINECMIRSEGCAHGCINTPGSYQCTCNSGYVLADNLKNCEDIDECEGNIDSCAQICINTNGSFQCSCVSGYSLSSDRRSCQQKGLTEGMKILVIVVATVLFVVVIAVVTLTVTSICVYLCTKKNYSVQIQTSSTARSIEMPTKEINNGTKDESCYETIFQDEHTYECM